MNTIQRTRKLQRRKPKKLSDDVLTLLKQEVVRIGLNGTRKRFKFAERMFTALPELRNA